MCFVTHPVPRGLWKSQSVRLRGERDLSEVTQKGTLVKGRRHAVCVHVAVWFSTLAPGQVTRVLLGLTGLCSGLPSLILDSLLLTNYEPRLFLCQRQHPAPRTHEPQDNSGAEEAAKERTQELL